jgi:hypothetical protein
MGDADVVLLVAKIDAQQSEQSRKAKIASLEVDVKAIAEGDTVRRVLSYRQLVALDPTNQAYIQKLKIYEDKQDAEAKRLQAQAKAEKRKQGVSIGMTKDEVLASSWGKPNHINSTHTVFGTHEQWVYDRFKNGYLYFDGDILTGAMLESCV